MRAALVVFLAVLVSCKGARQEDADAPAATAAAAGRPDLPPDHLAPGELIEGTEKIFALPVPRAMKVSWSFKDRGLAEGQVEPERVANFVRARVHEGKISVGASSTVFEDVRHTAEPLRLLRIRIERVRGKCQLEVLDVTPPQPGPDPGSDEARWRNAGFTPQGKPLDPLHMQ
jgi:hypothetical protein